MIRWIASSSFLSKGSVDEEAEKESSVSDGLLLLGMFDCALRVSKREENLVGDVKQYVFVRETERERAIRGCFRWRCFDIKTRYQNKFTDKFNKIEIQLANPFTDPFINN